ncbi:phosphoglycolate phosphatase [Haladaptatus sp. AB643]|uniref:phosphoglycolate phosphatase n=1 Tax=Haladaptatus sp. AB643 TaxID=2934174 RepID=UPI00209C2093|nr:phosphoglycolate phosphatase [Haladaptatus sp. AB643]MCO8246051.1 phosphoglycolate phosphatase [Haladaptatus sp. AB643]
MVPPLVLDIDGTMTRPDDSIDPRFFDLLPDWEAPVVIATGKAFPYPVSLCHFLQIPELVIAENGGIVLANDEITRNGDGDAARRVAEEYREAGHELGWGEVDLTNRWRETEIAVQRDQPLGPLSELASEYGQEVVDTGFAYHVKSSGVSKGMGIKAVAELLGRDLEEFVAIGDSENDVSTFGVVGESYAVANADEKAKRAAGTVIDESYSEGTISVLEEVREWP